MHKGNASKVAGYFIATLFSSLMVGSFVASPVQAVKEITINKNQIKKVASFDLEHKANAGGTVTSKYFVFPDNKGAHGGKTTLWLVDRNTCKTVDKVNATFDYISGLYNKWGTNYVTVIGKGEKKSCYKISGSKLKSATGCPTPTNRTLSYQGTGQGNTATFNNYTFKVAGYRGGRIGVWDKSGKNVLLATIPESVVKYEPENISIDGATGEVYINYARRLKDGTRVSLWYKINSSVFSEYTGKSKTSNPTVCKNSKAIKPTNTKTTPTKTNPTTPKTTPTTPATPKTTPTTPTTPKTTPTTNPQPTNQSHSTNKSTNSSSSNQSTSNKTNQESTTANNAKSCGGVDTILLNCDVDGKDAPKHILLLVIEILTIGIGILAVIGISVVGIQYLTAADDATKVAKAKRRMLEIVIGIVCYALLWVIAQWLLPGGSLNS